MGAYVRAYLKTASSRHLFIHGAFSGATCGSASSRRRRQHRQRRRHQHHLGRHAFRRTDRRIGPLRIHPAGPAQRCRSARRRSQRHPCAFAPLDRRHLDFGRLRHHQRLHRCRSRRRRPPLGYPRARRGHAERRPYGHDEFERHEQPDEPRRHQPARQLGRLRRRDHARAIPLPQQRADRNVGRRAVWLQGADRQHQPARQFRPAVSRPNFSRARARGTACSAPPSPSAPAAGRST